MLILWNHSQWMRFLTGRTSVCIPLSGCRDMPWYHLRSQSLTTTAPVSLSHSSVLVTVCLWLWWRDVTWHSPCKWQQLRCSGVSEPSIYRNFSQCRRSRTLGQHPSPRTAAYPETTWGVISMRSCFNMCISLVYNLTCCHLPWQLTCDRSMLKNGWHIRRHQWQ